MSRVCLKTRQKIQKCCERTPQSNYRFCHHSPTQAPSFAYSQSADLLEQVDIGAKSRLQRHRLQLGGVGVKHKENSLAGGGGGPNCG